MVVKNKIEKERVIVYVDGFNLYFGIKTTYPSLKWLNLNMLAQNLLKEHQILIDIKYYTAMISNNHSKVKRQVSYIDVLKHCGVKVILGQYKSKTQVCRSCEVKFKIFEEKMTDVNISVDLLMDAVDDNYDTAILISGDTDLIPPLKIIKKRFDTKKILAIFPPQRANKAVKKEVYASFTLGRKLLLDSQFENAITLSNGTQITKPKEWT